MNVKFITSNGYYQSGDVVSMTDGIARQVIREGRAVEYIDQSLVAELRRIANRRKPKPAQAEIGS